MKKSDLRVQRLKEVLSLLEKVRDENSDNRSLGGVLDRSIDLLRNVQDELSRENAGINANDFLNLVKFIWDVVELLRDRTNILSCKLFRIFADVYKKVRFVCLLQYV